MTPQLGLDAPEVAAVDRVHEVPVDPVRPLGVRASRLVLSQGDRGQRLRDGPEAQQHPVLGRRPEPVVQCHVSLVLGERVGVRPHSRIRGPCLVHGPQPPPARVVEDRPDSDEVERHAGAGDVADRVRLEPGDAEAAVGLLHEQAVLDEQVQRFAQRGPADVQRRSQFDLAQLVPRPELAEDDGTPDEPDDRLPLRRPREGPRRAHRLLPELSDNP